ncbi:MAG: hypothetical protein Q8S46_07460 [Methylotenera sp.]|nr:hypothetical protein [Methylotenera sp.]MDP1959917.1 hypothetical protein [Methylotenera sp.]MDP3086674.1 hypothetical protein [Methylotenera sp.]MDP3303975.1 hypothetical protein [Methylotenera sp.]
MTTKLSTQTSAKLPILGLALLAVLAVALIVLYFSLKQPKLTGKYQGKPL